jgi:hypothetical protein
MYCIKRYGNVLFFRTLGHHFILRQQEGYSPHAVPTTRTGIQSKQAVVTQSDCAGSRQHRRLVWILNDKKVADDRPSNVGCRSPPTTMRPCPRHLSVHQSFVWRRGLRIYSSMKLTSPVDECRMYGGNLSKPGLSRALRLRNQVNVNIAQQAKTSIP